MRIILLEPANPDFPEQISNALDLPLIVPTEQADAETGLISDDRTIQELLASVNNMNKDQLSSVNSNHQAQFIITQYPRSVTQAQSLDIALARTGLPVNTVLVMKSTISPQNRENKALIRYYRTQNKLILIDDVAENAASVDEICEKTRLNYARRRSRSSLQTRK